MWTGFVLCEVHAMVINPSCHSQMNDDVFGLSA